MKPTLLISLLYKPEDAFALNHRYEGEFVENHMEGAGVYTWHDGT